MSTYERTYGYDSKLDLPLRTAERQDSRSVKLGDLAEAFRLLHEHGPTESVMQVRRREGPAFKAATVIAELVNDDEILTDELAAQRKVEHDEFWRKYQERWAAEKLAEATVAEAAESPPETLPKPSLRSERR